MKRSSWCRTAALAVVLLPACAHAQAGVVPGPGSQSGWSQDRAPFVVRDSAGQFYPAPFLGGFDVPRPQLVDLDGDGDLDLFVQERSGEIIHFENVDGTFVWRSDRYHDLDVGEWYRFVDLDGDGRIDLLGESRYSHIRAWRNTGTATVPSFTMVADTLRDADGEPIFADRQNILNLTDIDADGRLDLFIGRVEGHLNRWETVDIGANGLPRFRLLEERWEGISIVGAVQTGDSAARPTLHGANTMAFGDVDGDGDLDLLWGDFFEPGILVIENIGDRGNPNFRTTPKLFPPGSPLITTGYNAPALGDVDGNGALDLILGVIGGAYQPARSSQENLHLVQQGTDGVWEHVTARLIRTIDVGSESMPVLADLDGDGDLDLLVGSKIDPADHATSRMVHFENIGTQSAPEFQERGMLDIAGEFHLAPAVADLDGDGLPDLLLGGWRDVVQFWRNTGTASSPAWTLADSALIRVTRGSNTAPALADLDGDGLFDLMVGEASGQLNLYRNVGTRTEPRFELVSDNLQQIDVGRRSTPTLADFNGDGAADLLIGAEDGHLELWRNVSSNGKIWFERDDALVLKADNYSAPTVGDLYNNGRLVLITGGSSGGLKLFRQ
ncbi:MAG: VCBS repeat-containing protein [Gemmatimonadales bacterium]|nr:VCBS repeat-containing protein [Gemmatimonadales bacterium]MDZ4389497.1 VCBS repeat-containing protein [Gemmatimonadales bacterium]